jgi:hypothetical protein
VPIDGGPTVASRKRLSGRQLRITHWQGSGKSGGSGRATEPRGRNSSPRGVDARLAPAAGFDGECPIRLASSRHRPDVAGTGRRLRAARTVEREGSSDMLPRLNCLGISRGFEFSVTCDRRWRPAAVATAIDRSRTLRRACEGVSESQPGPRPERLSAGLRGRSRTDAGRWRPRRRPPGERCTRACRSARHATTAAGIPRRTVAVGRGTRLAPHTEWMADRMVSQVATGPRVEPLNEERVR